MKENFFVDEVDRWEKGKEEIRWDPAIVRIKYVSSNDVSIKMLKREGERLSVWK